MKKPKKSNVFTIEPSKPFLSTVASSLCDGKLIDGFHYNGDPLCLSKVTIYVPTRRAARELRSAFMDHLGGQSILLPQIKTLGEFDEDASFFEIHADDYVKTATPIDSLERQLLLGGLIADWNKYLNRKLLALYESEELTTPVSTADSFWLARDLASLLDQLQTQDLTFADIDAAAAEFDADGWWGVTHAFLKIIAEEWPSILAQMNHMDPAAHRNLMLRNEAKRLAALKSSTPIIVAGSTGTIPATADLIATIATLPAGAVVLPGYDCLMREETKAQLVDANDLGSAVGHPQYGMHHLVLKMNAQDQVQPLGGQLNKKQQERHNWIVTALEPAPQTSYWPQASKTLDQSAFEGVELLETANERDEAAAIAAALREAIADPGIKSALVTPDRMLARRVIAELAKYGIEADDSGGTPFDISLQGTLLGLLFGCVFEQGDAASLLALLKSPLVQIGVNSQTHYNGVIWLERMVMRGGVGRFDFKTFKDFAAAQIAAWQHPDRYKPVWLKSVTDAQIEQAQALADRLQTALKPLVDLITKNGEVQLEQVLYATIESLEALCVDENGHHKTLYDGEAGTMLRALLTRFLASNSALQFEADQWPQIVRAFTSTMAIQPTAGGHPRVAIWGALEARLQSVDFLVIGGLNENVWPQQATNDAFLTRGMKTKMKMQQPERRIGLAAHDFFMGMGQSRVLLTRSARMDNAPSVASRWLQRMETLAGENTVSKMKKKGQRYVGIVHAIEKIADIPLEKRPCPTPSLSSRPNHFSVTEIERLRRDPYALYAKKILGLYPLEPLVRDPDAATRGTLIHRILEMAVKAKIDFLSTHASEELRLVAHDVFNAEALPPDIDIIWRLRFDNAVDQIIAWERKRSNERVTRFAELSSLYLPVDITGITLSGRADRLDLRVDGSVDIIDFKTGGVPTSKQVKSMLAPQMPLEAALLKRGAFEELGKCDPAQLLYVKLDPKGKVDFTDVRYTDKQITEADILAEQAWDKLVDVLAFYAEERNGYISRAIPALQHDFSGEYDHLARVMEWSSAVGEGEDSS